MLDPEQDLWNESIVKIKISMGAALGGPGTPNYYPWDVAAAPWATFSMIVSHLFSTSFLDLVFFHFLSPKWRQNEVPNSTFGMQNREKKLL